MTTFSQCPDCEGKSDRFQCFRCNGSGLICDVCGEAEGTCLGDCDDKGADTPSDRSRITELEIRVEVLSRMVSMLAGHCKITVRALDTASKAAEADIRRGLTARRSSGGPLG